MNLMKLPFLCLLFGCAVAIGHSGGALKAPYLPADTLMPDPLWFEQKLDHFSPDSGSKTWKQSYYINFTWWDREKGPVFLLLGGEGPADPAWVVADTNIMIQAKKYSALVFSIEHRFYGESHPTEDASLKNLKLLSSRQALADFSYFRDQMVILHNMTASHKWVSFGGSYSGALSAWLRQVYPKAVVGAVASSAPVLAKMDFIEYVTVVGQSIKSEDSIICRDVVETAFFTITEKLRNQRGWKSAEELFNVKPPLSSKMDTVQLVEILASYFEGVVQYNKDNKAFEGDSSNVTINDLCAIMKNRSKILPINRYAALSKFMQGGRPVASNYTAMIASLKETSWTSNSVKGGARQWTYQTCKEFGYFQTSSGSIIKLFGNYISLDYFTDICKQVFNIQSSEIAAAVSKTNEFYGGKNVTGTNIVFPNGSVDPWHALSVTQNISSTVTALYIEGTAHCANMYPPRDSDPQELTAARSTISSLLAKWAVA